MAVLLESHLLFEEHADQRTRLEHVCFVAESEWAGNEELARAVSGLVVRLLNDMGEEERELTELTRLAADGPLEQMTG